MEIRVMKTNTPGVMPAEDKLGFGKVFTDHMLVVDWSVYTQGYVSDYAGTHAKILQMRPQPRNACLKSSH